MGVANMNKKVQEKSTAIINDTHIMYIQSIIKLCNDIINHFKTNNRYNVFLLHHINFMCLHNYSACNIVF